MFFHRRREKTAAPAHREPRGPAGARAFAIGDVHGRLDLFDALLDRIAETRRSRPCGRDYLVLLGDLVDRGPDSRGVVERAMSGLPRDMETVFIAGNHEEMVLRVLGAESALIWDWLDYGGFEFAQSYGVEVGRLQGMHHAQAAAAIRAAVPPAHLAFLGDFADSFRFGDYLFVHAGIRPGTPVDRQEIRDLRWIREDFLTSEADHGCIVVHGHTISAEPDVRPNRIGIDTGAYASGTLTALCVEGAARSFLKVSRG